MTKATDSDSEVSKLHLERARIEILGQAKEPQAPGDEQSERPAGKFGVRGSSQVLLAHPIERMVRISRKAVDADVVAIAPQLDLPLRRLVARLAQALQFAGDECGPIAAVRCDLIDHVRSRHDPALQAEFAQRVLPQLQPAQSSPACRLVEAVP